MPTFAYTFNGAERASYFFRNPNDAALFFTLAVIAVATVGFGLVIRQSTFEKRSSLALLALLALSALYLEYMLSRTFSRGGGLALTAGMLVLLLYPTTRGRLYVCFLLASYWTITLFLPQGLERVISISSIQSDLAIANRLTVWRGAFAIATDHPLTGVGFANLLDSYLNHYQPLDNQTIRYGPPIGDYFVIVASYGFFALSAYSLLLGALTSMAVTVSLKNRQFWILGLASALASFAIASTFRTYIKNPLFLGILGSLMLVTIFSIWRFRKKSFLKSTLYRVIPFLLACNLLVFAFAILQSKSFESKPMKLPDELHEEGLQLLGFQPRMAPATSTILFISESNKVVPYAKNLLRPLAAEGHQAIFISIKSFGLAGLETLQRKLDELNRLYNIVAILGHGEGGRFAQLLDAPSSTNAVIAINAPSFSPVPNLSTLSFTGDSQRMIIHTKDNMKVDVGNATELDKASRERGVGVRLLLLDSGGHYIFEHSNNLVNPIREFIEKTLNSH